MTFHSTISGTDWLTDSFDTLSLDELNNRAEMLSRIDNKYVIPRSALARLVPSFATQFDILAIDGQRSFSYDTRYFDDVQRSAYYEHHQGLRKGFKVRVRRYVDTGLCYMEVKVKGARGRTEKFRLPYDADKRDALTPEAKQFAIETYENQYGKSFAYDLKPSLDLRYSRITLVSRHSEERMTIDTDLKFSTPFGTISTGTDVFIIEAKSALGRGYADRLIREMGHQPTKRCSKYCIGMAAMGEVTRYNRFLPTMRKLGFISDTPRDGSWSQIRQELKANFMPSAAAAAPNMD